MAYDNLSVPRCIGCRKNPTYSRCGYCQECRARECPDCKRSFTPKRLVPLNTRCNPCDQARRTEKN